MPNPIIKSFSKKSGKSQKEVERLWDKAVSIVTKQHGVDKDDGDKFYPIVVSILKKLAGIKVVSETAEVDLVARANIEYKRDGFVHLNATNRGDLEFWYWQPGKVFKKRHRKDNEFKLVKGEKPKIVKDFISLFINRNYQFTLAGEYNIDITQKPLIWMHDDHLKHLNAVIKKAKPKVPESRKTKNFIKNIFSKAKRLIETLNEQLQKKDPVTVQSIRANQAKAKAKKIALRGRNWNKMSFRERARFIAQYEYNPDNHKYVRKQKMGNPQKIKDNLKEQSKRMKRGVAKVISKRGRRQKARAQRLIQALRR